jgi:hypothetical protein
VGPEDGALMSLINKEVGQPKRLSYFFIVILLVHLTYVYAEDKRYVIPLEDSPAFGPKNAQITIIEFLDYQ